MSNQQKLKRTKNKKKKQSLVNAKFQLQMIRALEPKFLDITSIANSVGAGGTIFNLSPVSQGASQSDRIGDFIHTLKLYFNFTLYCVNSDIVTTIRLIFFRWIPNGTLLSPALGNILQNPSAANVLSHFNFQYQQNYRVLKDMHFQASGITVAPTVSSNFGQVDMPINLGGNKEIEFTPGANLGTNQLYLCAISDSSLTPFPILNFVSRLYFEDVMRTENVPKLLK
jgi:hypothetical protein